MIGTQKTKERPSSEAQSEEVGSVEEAKVGWSSEQVGKCPLDHPGLGSLCEAAVGCERALSAEQWDVNGLCPLPSASVLSG